MSTKIEPRAFHQSEQDSPTDEQQLVEATRGDNQEQRERDDLYLASTDGVRLADPNTQIVIATTDNLAAKYQRWRNSPTTWGEFKALLLDFDSWPVCARKESAPAFVGGELLDSPQQNVLRGSRRVVSIHLEISDHDDGQTMEESEIIARRNNRETVIAPSFNFGSTEIEIKRDDYIKWAKENGKPVEISEAVGREYLEATGKLLPAFARSATFDGSAPKQKEDGTFVYAFTTMPREKHRCISPLGHGIRVGDYMVGDTTHAQFIEAYKEGVRDHLNGLGCTFDQSCTELARAYYSVVQREGNPLPKPRYVRGEAIDLEPYLRAALQRVKEKLNSKGRPRGSSQNAGIASKSGPVEFEGRDIVRWYVNHKDFDFEALFADKGLVKSERPAGGVFVECFHDCHSDGDNETFLENGDGDRGFTLHCSGASGGCPEITDRLVRLTKYMEAGKLTIEDLENPAYGGGPVPLVKPTKEAIREAIGKLGTDSTSDDWDATVERIARFGDESFDAEALELICKRTGMRMKGALRTKLKEFRQNATRDNRVEQAPASDGRELFDNWDINGKAFADTCQDVVNVLIKANAKSPRLFSMGHGPSRLVKNPITGQIVPKKLDYASMRHELAKVTRFGRTKRNKNGEEYFQDVPVPEAIAQHVINDPDLPIPVLNGVTDTPYFDRNANLVTVPGYDVLSKIYYEPPAGFVLKPIPAEPTDADIENAKAKILEAICDFPFNDGAELDPQGKGQSSRANFVAKLVQPFVREMIDQEPCPLHLTQKPKQRTGASLLTRLYSEAVFGGPPAFETAKGDEAEQQKTIVTHIKAASRHIVIDNWPQNKVCDDPTTASLITATRYQGRQLGENAFICGEWKGVLEINGNNVQLSDEIRERTLLVRLDAAMENPNERTEFKHPFLIQWVKENRADLVWSVLTLVQAWIWRGRMPWSGKALGGFEAYCTIVGGILENAGIEGFLENRKLLRTSVGSGDDSFKSFVQLWWNTFNTSQVKVGALEFRASPEDYLEEYSEPRAIETLLDLYLVHSDEITLPFNGWKKTGWQKGMGAELTAHKDQVFDLEDGVRVRLHYRKPTGSGQRAWLEHL